MAPCWTAFRARCRRPRRWTTCWASLAGRCAAAMTRLAKRPILATRPSRAGVVRKSARELELMRHAAHINGLALAALRAAAKSGVTTRQLDVIAERVIVANKGVPAFKG